MDANTILLAVSTFILGWVKMDMMRIERKIDSHVTNHG